MTVRYRGLFFDNARWEGFLLRPGDIVVTTPAKCGTTWTQTICAFLARGRTDLGAPLDEISPWLDSQLRPVTTVHAALDAQSGRRVIKSHTPLDGLPSVPGVHYVCVGRDLRDAFASWDDHVANVDPGRLLAARSAAAGFDDLTELFPDGLPSRPAEFSARFREWVDAPLRTPTGASDLNLALALAHLTGAWERRDDPAVVLLHYEDLRSDLGAQMALVADRLGIRPDPMTWDDLVGAATFERMRERAVDFAPETTSGIWRDTGAFFRSARSGGWRSEIAATDRGCYVDRCRQLAPADLLDWIHRDGGEVAGTSGGRPAPGADRDD